MLPCISAQKLEHIRNQEEDAPGRASIPHPGMRKSRFLALPKG
ncbi:hypothetical protein HMPREF1861_01571 [Corynebacterium kroppenstedtii]|nr:hypothetical protein HMPREF1861_01571 [Corynebacterium kroppenstedtii]